MRIPNTFFPLALGLGVTTLGVLTMIVLGAPVSLGKNIPQDNLLLDYTYGVLFAVAGYGLLLLFPVKFSDRLRLCVIWNIKVVVVLVFMLFYENFYWALDTYGYFDLPRSPGFRPEGFGIGHGTDNIYSLIWVYYQILPESFHALKVVFSFLGLVGVYLFYRAAVLFMNRESPPLLYTLALFPSILFWSSILGKDPVVLLGIGLYSYGAVAWYREHRPRALLWLSAGLLIAIFIRSWLGPILIAPLLATFMLSDRSVGKKLAIGILVGGALAYTMTLVGEQFALETAQDVLSSIDTTTRGLSEGGSGQQLGADLTQPSQLVAALPFAMFTALFRPLPGEITNAFGLLAGLENLVLLLLFIIALWRFRLKEMKEPVVMWAATLILAWTLAYAFISYENLGGAVRFRLQILPILLALLLYFATGITSYRNRTLRY